MILTAIMELLGVGSVLPFVSIITRPEIIETNKYINSFYVFLNSPEKTDFLVICGGLFFVILVIAMILNIYTVLLSTKFSYRLGGQLATGLFYYYLSQPMVFHYTHTSSQLIARVRTETRRVAMRIIMTSLKFNSKIFSIMILSIFLVIVNPIVALSAIIVFLMSYMPIYYFLGKRAKENGHVISTLEIEKNRLMYDSFSSIREINLYTKAENIKNKFEEVINSYTSKEAENELFRHTPYYLIETLSMLFVITITLFFMIKKSDELQNVLPLIVFYAFAGYKLIPMFQQCYRALVAIRGAIPAYERIRDDLLHACQERTNKLQYEQNEMTFNHEMKFQNVTFSYPESDVKVFEKLNFSIYAGQNIAIIGKTGAGKSTLIDLLMALIIPDEGSIIVDGVKLNEQNRHKIWEKIGYVPQNVYLIDSTIAENISFGVNDNNLDFERIWWALKVACLDDFVRMLPDGLNSKVGEKGARLSGGQIQRLGIARAIYRKTSLLIFDEATNGLDVNTQSKVMENIYNLEPKVTTIWVTHRLEILKYVNVAYELIESKLVMIDKIS